MTKFYTSEILLTPTTLDSNSLDYLQRVVSHYLQQRLPNLNPTAIAYYNSDLANFPIEEVRRLLSEAAYSAHFSKTSERALVLLNFDSASTEAQNAALKIIEESPPDTLILLVANKPTKILDTINSRCITIHAEKLGILSNTSGDQLLESNDNQNPEGTALAPDNDLRLRTYGDCIQLASTYKDRLAAKQLIEQLLQNSTKPIHDRAALLRAYQDLEANQNVQLILEECLFSQVKKSG